MIIQRDQYDDLLINLLQSYADFKQSTIDMEKLVEIEQEQIVENTENRRATRRNPKKIKQFFSNVFEGFTDGKVMINDVKFKFDQFRKYVKVVSNYEIELIDAGDPSELKKYLKELWKKLAKEHQLKSE